MTRLNTMIGKLKSIYPGLTDDPHKRDTDLIKRVLTRLTGRVGGPGSAVVLAFDTTSYPSEIVVRNSQRTVLAVIHMSELEAIVKEVA